MGYCKFCGSELKTNASFCSVCGAKIMDELDEIAIRFLNGDQDAFSMIYSSTYSWVIKFISARVNSSDVEDCAQQAYLKLYNNIGLYNPQAGRFRPWFNTLLSNCCKDFYRSVARYNSRMESMYDEEDNEIEFVDPGITPEQYMEQKDIANIVGQVLSELNDNQRQCLMLYYIEGMKYQEIADTLDIPLNSVKSSINKGKAKAQTKLVEMEKRGVKLFNIAPFPLFIILLRSCDFSLFYSFAGVWSKFIGALAFTATTGAAGGAAMAGTGAGAMGFAGAQGGMAAGTVAGATAAGAYTMGGNGAAAVANTRAGVAGGQMINSGMQGSSYGAGYASIPAGPSGSAMGRSVASKAASSVGKKIATSIVGTSMAAALVVGGVEFKKLNDEKHYVGDFIETQHDDQLMSIAEFSEIAASAGNQYTENGSGTVNGQGTEVSNTGAFYKKIYADKLNELIADYGDCKRIEYSKLRGKKDSILGTAIAAYTNEVTYTGLIFASMMDMDADGVDELVYAYRDGYNKKVEGYIYDVDAGLKVHEYDISECFVMNVNASLLSMDINTPLFEIIEMDGEFFVAGLSLSYDNNEITGEAELMAIRGEKLKTVHTIKFYQDSVGYFDVDGKRINKSEVNDNIKEKILIEMINIDDNKSLIGFTEETDSKQTFSDDLLRETKNKLGM